MPTSMPITTTMPMDRIASLTQLRDQLTGCIGCGCLSLKDCPRRNPGDKLGRDGPGPRRLINPKR